MAFPINASVGSLNFNGSNWLSYGTGGWLSADHTVEAWINTTAFSSVSAIAGESNGTSVDAWEWTLNATSIGIGYRSGVITSVSASYNFSANTWYHVAFSRVSATSTVYLFVNGALLASGTISGWTNQSVLSIGRLEANYPYYFNGLITNFRIVKGAALYTSSFTPSTAPLTAVAGTAILLNAASAGAYITDSSANAYVLTNNGSVAYSASTPFLVASNNSLFTQNGTTYQYSTASGSWTRVSGTATNLTAQGLSISNIIGAVSSSSGAVVVKGGVGLGGNLSVGGNLAIGGALCAPGIRRTTAATAPANPTVGDLWYWTTYDSLMQYTSDGVGSYWVDITGSATANISSRTS